MSILRINMVFFGPNMAASQPSLVILNTIRLISPERGFRGSNFVRFILGVYMFCWYCRLTYLKIGQIGGYVPLTKYIFLGVI